MDSSNAEKVWEAREQERFEAGYRYTDAALRLMREGFMAGLASRDAEVAELTSRVDTPEKIAASDAALVGPVLRALAESRARFADSEARRAELEAVIDHVRRWNVGKEFLAKYPSVVLEDRDRENRAIGWDEARERFNDDNYRQGCICLNADHRREHPAMHWLNPYRGDNR